MNKQKVGYALSAQDNDTYMFGPDDPVERCGTCHYRRDLSAYNPRYKLKSYRRDLSATYDGFWIVTDRFRDFCTGQGYRDISFEEFAEDKRHFNFMPLTVVKFDAVSRMTSFEKLCPECGSYESVTGAYPAYVLLSEPLADGFYRSDLLFASGDEKHPIIFVGAETKDKLAKSGLKGLEFSPLYGSRPQT